MLGLATWFVLSFDSTLLHFPMTFAISLQIESRLYRALT